MHDEAAHRSPSIDGSISISAAHPLDVVIALVTRWSKLFSRGWGDESLLTRLSSPVSYHDPPPSVSVTWSPRGERGGILRRDGSFASPLKLLPKEASTAHARAWTRAGNHAAVVILAASRDEGYQVRERVFGPLVRLGFDLYFMENPFYGLRRTRGGPGLITVSDHGMMVLGMVLEARALLEHLREHYQKVAVAGYSMGGHMAAITAAVSPFPLACAAMAAGASAGSVYIRGLLSWCVDFRALGAAFRNFPATSTSSGPVADAGSSGSAQPRDIFADRTGMVSMGQNVRGSARSSAAARERLLQLFAVADVTCFPPPQRPDAAVIAGCQRDGYVLRRETERLHQHWPGSILRWIPAGHFSALISSRRALCDCVADAVGKL